MKFFTFTIAMLLVVSLLGCATEPKVKISKITTGDTQGQIKFKLPKTVVNIVKTESAPDATGKNISRNIAVVTSQIEANDNVYAIAPDDGFGIETRLNFTHTSDSNYLLSTLGVEVEDNRIKTIQEVAGLVTTIIPFTAGAEGVKVVSYPIRIDITDAYLSKETKDGFSYTGAELINGWKYNISFTSLSADVIPLSQIDQLLDRQTNVFFTTACRTATIEFNGDGDDLEGKSFTFLIADPNFIQTVKIPAKGNIKMRSSCGVDITSEKAASDSTAKVLEALLTQGKAVVDAIDKDKKGTKN